MNNYYIENVSTIAKIGLERRVDWTVAISMFASEYGIPAEYDECNGEKVAEFYDFVRGKIYDIEGNFVGYVKDLKK